MYKSNITGDYIDKIVVREKAVAIRTVMQCFDFRVISTVDVPLSVGC